jgi:endonuclease/exonuclease/phosphatase family metal-dependent hydrolase
MLRVTTWNLAWFGQLLQGRTRTTPQRSRAVTDAAGKALQALQVRQIGAEIEAIDPDILCVQEGPSTGNVQRLEAFCADTLRGGWTVVTRPRGEPYLISGAQGIFFLVRTARLEALAPQLLPNSRWIAATEAESRIDPFAEASGEHGRTWPIVHPWFKPDEKNPGHGVTDADFDGEGDPPPAGLTDRVHAHYRHPQVLVCTVNNRRVDFVGLHLKSKFSHNDYERAGALRRKPKLKRAEVALIAAVEQAAVSARVRISTEVANVRYYIENRFRNEPDPALFVLGDLNDGPGKEYFERRYLFHDLIGGLQGEVFFARRFLNHALFDYAPRAGENHRWTVRFRDAWDPARPEEILLDHIAFTQALTGPEALARIGLRVPAKAGRVEHEIHNAINAVFARDEDFTSDHRPVTVDVETAEEPPC